jgi:hypothetical protein
MIPKASNSRLAACRSHSLTRRCTSGSESRRRSGRGGKSGSWPPAPLTLPAAARFYPDQKTIAPHDQHGLARKPVPAPPLILIPAQRRFCLLMIRLHPVPARGILDQHRRGRRARKVTPELLPIPLLPPARTVPEQPPHGARAIPLHPPAAQGEKLRPPPPFGPLTPGEAAPGPPGVCDQYLVDPTDRARLAPAQHDTAMGPHGPHVAFLALRSPMEKIRVIPLIGIPRHTRRLHPTAVRFLQQR